MASVQLCRPLPPGSSWICDRTHTADGLLHCNNHNVPAEIEVRGIKIIIIKWTSRQSAQLVLYIQEFPSSDLCLETDYTDWGSWFLHSLQENAKVVYEVRPRPLPPTSVTIRRSTIRITEFPKEIDTSPRQPVYNERTEFFPAYIC